MGGALQKIRDDMQALFILPDGSLIAATMPREEMAGGGLLWVLNADLSHPRRVSVNRRASVRMRRNWYVGLVTVARHLEADRRGG